MMQQGNIPKEELMPHSLSLEGRARLKLSGVKDVERFDENAVVLVTSAGGLVVYGSGLHIGRLSLETGELGIDGRVDRLIYTDESEVSGFWSRLFR